MPPIPQVRVPGSEDEDEDEPDESSRTITRNVVTFRGIIGDLGATLIIVLFAYLAAAKIVSRKTAGKIGDLHRDLTLPAAWQGRVSLRGGGELREPVSWKLTLAAPMRAPAAEIQVNTTAGGHIEPLARSTPFPLQNE